MSIKLFMNKWRNIFISLFVIVWSLAFHYESLRAFYLEPLTQCSLPKIKFLFPPAGWIMFYNVDESYGHARIFGMKGKEGYEINPHEVFRVRTIGFDNIHRGVINAASAKRRAPSFCRQLYRRFPQYESFKVVYTYYPRFVSEPDRRYQELMYKCVE